MADGYLISLLFKHNKLKTNNAEIAQAKQSNKQSDWINQDDFSNSLTDSAKEVEICTEKIEDADEEEDECFIDTSECHVCSKKISSLQRNSALKKTTTCRFTYPNVCCPSNFSEENITPPSSAAHTTSEISEKLQSYLKHPEFPSEFFKDCNSESDFLESKDLLLHNASDLSFPSSSKNEFLSSESSLCLNSLPVQNYLTQLNDLNVFQPPTGLIQYETAAHHPSFTPEAVIFRKNIDSKTIENNKTKQHISSNCILPRKSQGTSSRYIPRAIAAVAAPLCRKFRHSQQHPPSSLLHQESLRTFSNEVTSSKADTTYDVEPPIRSFALAVIPCLQGALAVRQNRVPSHKTSVFSSSSKGSLSKSPETLLSEVIASEKSMCWLKIVGWGGTEMSGKKWLFLTDLLSFEKMKKKTTIAKVENNSSFNKDNANFDKDTTRSVIKNRELAEECSLNQVEQQFTTSSICVEQDRLLALRMFVQYIKVSRSIRCISRAFAKVVQGITESHEEELEKLSDSKKSKTEKQVQNTDGKTIVDFAVSDSFFSKLSTDDVITAANNETTNTAVSLENIDLVTTRLLHDGTLKPLISSFSSNSTNNYIDESSFNENASKSSCNFESKKEISGFYDFASVSTTACLSQKLRKQSSIGTGSTAPGSVVVSSLASTEDPSLIIDEMILQKNTVPKSDTNSSIKNNLYYPKEKYKCHENQRQPRCKWMPCVSACFVEVIIFLQSIMELFHKAKSKDSAASNLPNAPKKTQNNNGSGKQQSQRHLFSGTAYWIIVLALWLERRLHVVAKKSNNPFLLQTYCCCRVFTLDDIHLTRFMHTKYVSSKISDDSPEPPLSNENLLLLKNKIKKPGETSQRPQQAGSTSNDYNNLLLDHIFKHLETIQLNKEHDDISFQLGSQIDTLRRFLVLCFCAWSWIDDRKINSNNLTAILHQAWCCTHAQISFGLLDTTQGKKRVSAPQNESFEKTQLQYSNTANLEKAQTSRRCYGLRQGKTLDKVQRFNTTQQQKSPSGNLETSRVTCYYKEYLALPTCCSSMDFEVQVFSFLKKLGYTLSAVPECLKHLSQNWRKMLEEEDCCIRFCKSAFDTERE